uniref:G-protein coupled receptors family 1 profile domain-containing protein n=1 Tax=Ascaris lumbricoides TaxID=6252 RepID=A0A9J2Q810_ASCLU
MSDASYETQIEVPPTNAITLSDDLDAKLERQWYYLLLSVVPIACILGNCMVVAAVWTTKALQTPTNYLLVSLAVADLVVGTFVMPFSIYLSVNALHWHLPLPVCYFYCVLDVAASTCSIVHLVLISIDRLVAATKPAEYKTVKHRKRVYIAIALAWVFSIGLSLPLGTSLNTKTRHFLVSEHHCGIYSPIYMFCSSIFAFYLPCLVMIFTYSYIFYTLRRRLRAIQLQEMAGGQFVGFGADVGNIANSAMQTVIGVAPSNRNAISWEKPLLKKIEETAAEHASSLNESEREQLQNILDAVQPSSSSSQDTTQCEDLRRRPSVLLGAVTLRPSITENNAFDHGLQVPRPLHVRSMQRRFSETVQTFSERSRQAFLAESEVGTDVMNRRYSYQPESDATRRRSGDHSDNLRVPHEKRRMRRLSNIISEWERPSRSSISHMYSLARRESVYIARRKLAGLKDWALDLLAKLRSKQGIAIRRETRATKLVAIVMVESTVAIWFHNCVFSCVHFFTVVFLVCWLPFFTLNMVKVYKLMFNYWPTDLEVWFHWFTALGYLNSSLNFFIYSAINQVWFLLLKRTHSKVPLPFVVFLVCWLPFFTLNMVKVYKLMFNYWPTDLEVWFHWFTALGYLNSSLNFFIYSAINQVWFLLLKWTHKFRSSFRRLMRYRRSKLRTTWMLPPKESSRPLVKCCACALFKNRSRRVNTKQSFTGGDTPNMVFLARFIRNGRCEIHQLEISILGSPQSIAPDLTGEAVAARDGCHKLSLRGHEKRTTLDFFAFRLCLALLTSCGKI